MQSTGDDLRFLQSTGGGFAFHVGESVYWAVPSVPLIYEHDGLCLVALRPSTKVERDKLAVIIKYVCRTHLGIDIETTDDPMTQRHTDTCFTNHFHQLSTSQCK